MDAIHGHGLLVSDDDDDDTTILLHGMMQHQTLMANAFPSTIMSFMPDHVQPRPKKRYKAYIEPRKFHRKAASLSPAGLLHTSHKKRKQAFRIDDASFKKLCDRLFPRYLNWEDKDKRNLNAVTHAEAMRMFLYYLTCEGSWSHVGLLFGRQCDVVKRYVQIIAHVLAHELKDEYIQWPNAEEQHKTARHWLDHSMFLGAMGVVDGTHIKLLDIPTQDWSAKWKCYKGYHACNVQAIVDEDLRWRWIGIGCHGSMHDSGAFKSFAVSHDRKTYPILPSHHILGDPAYELSTWLLTPYDGSLQHAQQQYNTLHSAARMSVERAFGVMKQRFPRLRGIKVGRALKKGSKDRKWDMIWNTITAYFVLHNMLLEESGYAPSENEDFVFDDAWDDFASRARVDLDDHHTTNNTAEEKYRARRKRNMISAKYAQSNVSSRYHYGNNVPPVILRQ